MVEIKNLSIYDNSIDSYLVEGLNLFIPNGLIYIESEESDKLFEIIFALIFGIAEKIYSHYQITYDTLEVERPKKISLSLGHAYTQLSGLFDLVEDELKGFARDWDRYKNHISELLKRNLYSLSGGELQKVMLIRNISNFSELTLLHNQFSELDNNNKQVMLNSLAKKESAIVYDKLGPAYFQNFNYCFRYVEEIKGLKPIDYERKILGEKITNNSNRNREVKPKVILENLIFGYTKDNTLIDRKTIIFDEGLNFLLGENGSGKTTVFKILTGVIKKYKGEVLIEREKVNDYLTNNSIGISFQNPELSLFNLDVKKELGVLLKDKNKIFLRALQIFKLDKILNKEIGELDFNQKKKITLVQALIGNPEIILFDEPTQNFSSFEKQQVREYFSLLLDSRKTIIAITHSEDFVNSFNGTQFSIINLS